MANNPMCVPWTEERGKILDDIGDEVTLSKFSLSCGYNPDDSTSNKRTRFTMNAVNCHGELLDALEELRDAVTQLRSDTTSGLTRAKVDLSLIVAQKILIKAKGDN